MGSFLSFLLGQRKTSAKVAKDIKVNVERQQNLDVLEVKIELPEAR